jgi:hypothetical protein
VTHGTTNGARAHYEAGEKPCEECLEANRAASREYYWRVHHGVLPPDSKAGGRAVARVLDLCDLYGTIDSDDISVHFGITERTTDRYLRLAREAGVIESANGLVWAK